MFCNELQGTHYIECTLFFIILAVDTYGVMSVELTDTPDDNVTVLCLFNTFSTDTGCTVELLSTDGPSYYEGTFSKTGLVAEGNISGVANGSYNVRAFDEGSNVVAVEIMNINITGEPSATVSTRTTVATSVSVSTSLTIARSATR